MNGYCTIRRPYAADSTLAGRPINIEEASREDIQCLKLGILSHELLGTSTTSYVIWPGQVS